MDVSSSLAASDVDSTNSSLYVCYIFCASFIPYKPVGKQQMAVLASARFQVQATLTWSMDPSPCYKLAANLAASG
jgi:hypothetical protein